MFHFGELPVIFDGKYAHQQDRAGRKQFAYFIAVTERHAKRKHNSPHHAGQRIDLLPEDERRFVDKNIAYHSAGDPCNRTHRNSHPERIIQFERLLYADDDEERQTDRVENKERRVQPYQLLAENKYNHHPQQRTVHVRGTQHPEGVTSSSKSRNVPPPIAVTSPTTNAPNQSNSFAAAKRIPLMAKTIVPAYSIISLSENSEV